MPVIRPTARRTATLATAAALALMAGGAWAQTTIRVVSKDLLTTNPADVAHVERIEEAMAAQGRDIDIEIVDLPSSGYADALSVMLLSGDIPDLIYFQGGDAAMVDQGILEDWRPWIEQAPNLQAALYPHNEARLENYPYLLYVFPPRVPQPVIRADWLERAGTGVPETTDGYLALFRAIRDGDLDGNGQADTYGITVAGNPGGTDELDAIFDRAFGITGDWMQDAAGAWISSRVSDQERAKLEFYRTLFAEGLLDPEYVTMQWDVKEDKFYTGRAGVILGSSMEVIDIYGGKLRQVEPEAELALLPPPIGPSGEGGLQAIDVSKESRGWAMSALSENKEEVVALLDFLASPEGQMMDRMGFEGEQYTRTGDAVEVTPEIATWYARFLAASNWEPPVQWLSEAAQGSLARIEADFVPDTAFVLPAEAAADADAANQVYRSWSFRFISGDASFDQWDEFVEEWTAAGGGSLTEIARSTLGAE